MLAGDPIRFIQTPPNLVCAVMFLHYKSPPTKWCRKHTYISLYMDDLGSSGDLGSTGDLGSSGDLCSGDIVEAGHLCV